MLPSCYCYSENAGAVRLYLGETSTEACLELLPATDPVAILEFGAIPDGGGWTSLAELPPITNCSELLSFLRVNQQLELIDFAATIGEVFFWTHDDGEAELQFPSRSALAVFLNLALGPEVGAAVLAAVIANPGKYVVLSDGTFTAFETFDAYLAGA